MDRPAPITVSAGRRDLWARSFWAIGDVATVAAATFAAELLRYDFVAVSPESRDVAAFAVVFTAVFAVGGAIVGPYTIRHIRGSFEEAYDLVMSVGTAVLLTMVLNAFTGLIDVPHGLPLLAGVFAVGGMFAARFLVRTWRHAPRSGDVGCEKVIVYGAGDGGRQLIRALQTDRSATARYRPVALVDDDPRKRRLRIDGLRVAGGWEALERVAGRTGARTVVVAIPSASPEALRFIQEEVRRLALDLLVLPRVSELIGPPKVRDLRELNLEDLLSRPRVALDDTAISETIAGRCVLVTGAGGSIGSELCRQIARFGPGRLVLLDRDESALFEAQLSLTGRALLDDGTLALCDIRDRAALQRVFDEVRPDVVFHAAALKHLTLLERHPMEAWKSNVLGTRNVLAAASAAGVGSFVNISTDKAAEPTSVLGYSKRVAERLTAEYASRSPGRYVSVRFGNVLGSRGSVISAFTSQIQRGGPLTVTHPDVERYFMLIPEACQLVLQATALGADGEAMVLDMGRPVRILDVANSLIHLCERTDITIEFTGLRPGEKLTEDLFTPLEDVRPTAHPLISHFPVPPVGVEEVLSFESRDSWSVIRRLRELSVTSPEPSDLRR